MNQNLKKFTAISMAAFLGLTTVPVSASTQSFTEVSQAVLDDAITGLIEQYALNFQQYEALQSGIHEDITLTLDDTGRSLLGFMVPMDISWFKDVRLSADISTEENAQFMTTGLYMNDTKLCTVEFFFDLENMEIYLRVPELRDAYIKVDYKEAMRQQQAMLEQQDDMETDDLVSETAEEALDSLEDSPFTDPEFMKGYLSVINNLPEYMPEPAVLEELLSKYSSLLFNYIKDEKSESEILSIGTSQMECTTCEGRLSQADAQAFMKEVVDTAKSDAQIRVILDKLDHKLPTEDGLYESFSEALDDLSEDLNEELEDDNSYLSATLSQNKDGAIAGFSLTINSEEEILPVLDWKRLETDGHVASSLQFGPEEDGTSLIGEGVIENGILTGSYKLRVEQEELADIEVVNYDTTAMENGEFNGSYRITAPVITTEGETPEEHAMNNPLQNFAMLLDLTSTKDSGKIQLTLESSGASLGNLLVEAKLGTPVEKPAFQDTAEVYDSLDENAMNEYMSGISLDSISGNLMEAGMPEELIAQLFANETITE